MNVDIFNALHYLQDTEVLFIYTINRDCHSGAFTAEYSLSCLAPEKYHPELLLNTQFVPRS